MSRPVSFGLIRRYTSRASGPFPCHTHIPGAASWTNLAWSPGPKTSTARIFTYVRYRVGSDEVAEDIAATVFLEAVERIASFTYRGVPVSAWLYRIAHNLAADHFRRDSRRPVEPLDDGVRTSSTTPDDIVERDVARQDLAVALEALTDDQRQVVLLKFIGGFTGAQVAEILEKPEGAVKSLQHRALKALRRTLEREDLHAG